MVLTHLNRMVLSLSILSNRLTFPYQLVSLCLQEWTHCFWRQVAEMLQNVACLCLSRCIRVIVGWWRFTQIDEREKKDQSIQLNKMGSRFSTAVVLQQNLDVHSAQQLWVEPGIVTFTHIHTKKKKKEAYIQEWLVMLVALFLNTAFGTILNP